MDGRFSIVVIVGICRWRQVQKIYNINNQNFNTLA
jgi:hypothetical protein